MDEKVRQNLVDAGCSEGFIDDYAAAGSGSEQLCRLRQHRKELLRRIHDGQRQLDCLDYLIYQVKRGKSSTTPD
uniref:hypothetical protein n=1 Tax=Megasphaera elsdenii TaxID=907 RepID=UPI003FEE43CD